MRLIGEMLYICMHIYMHVGILCMIHNHIVIICNKKKNNKCRRVSGEGSAELQRSS
jgi:hypothetical protein